MQLTTQPALAHFELTILRETAAWASAGFERIQAFVEAMHDYGLYSDMERTQWSLERRGLLDRGWEITDAGRELLGSL